MSKHTRDLFVPFLDTTCGKGETRKWVPIDLSTVFTFSFNPTTETKAYICQKADTNDTTGYAPSMDQEIELDTASPMYAFMREFCMKFPIGSDAKIPCLIAMPSLEDNTPTVGYLWEDAAVSPQSIDTVAGKVSFTLNFNGDVKVGTVAGVGTNTVSFTEQENE